MTEQPRYLKSAGDAGLGLRRHPTNDTLMLPVLTLTDTDTGRKYMVEISAAEVKDLRDDAARLVNADQAQVTQWWQALADGSDGRPRARRSTAHTAPGTGIP